MARKKSKSAEVVNHAARAEVSSDIEKALASEGLEVLAPVKVQRTYIPTGISSFDHETLGGLGGIPSKCITNIWGPKTSGKSTLNYRILAMAQRQRPERLAVLYDAEFSYNPEFARAQGVDTDKLQVIQDNNAEIAYDKILKYVKTGVVSIVSIDSLAALVTKNQEEGKWQPGEFARVTKGFCNRLVKYIFEHDTACTVVNQVTQLIGIMYGDNKDFPGGEAFKHAIQLSLRCRKAGWEGESKTNDPEGIIIAVTVDKNKLAPMRKTNEDTHVVLYFENGIEKSIAYSLYDDALRAGVISGSGWMSLVDPTTGATVEKWQGKDKVKEALVNDDELAKRVRDWVYDTRVAVSPAASLEPEEPAVPAGA